MGQPLAPMPHADDPRWTRPIITLLNISALLDVGYELLKLWAVGESRTVLGTRVTVHHPVAPSMGGSHGMQVLVPLVGVAALVFMKAMRDAGAPGDAVTGVLREVEDRHRLRPVAAHSAARAVLPPALATVAEEEDRPGLLAPIERTDDGWRFGPVVQRALGGFSYDLHGWVEAVDVPLAGEVTVRLSADAEGPRTVTPRDPVDAAQAMFRGGQSVGTHAVARGRSPAAGAAALRRQV